jgi:hypothetical protein
MAAELPVTEQNPDPPAAVAAFRMVELDKRTQSICAKWLREVIYPMALGAARLEPAPSEDVLVALRLREDVAAYLDAREKAVFSARQATDFCDKLAIVAVANTLAHFAGDAPSARETRDVIVLLAQLDGFELSNAHDLRQSAADALYPGPEDPMWADRENDAEAAFDRWRALDGPVAAALVTWSEEIYAVLPAESSHRDAELSS